MKPNADGRKDGSKGQRGILGFEWRTAPLPYQPLPIDEEVCAAEEPSDDEREEEYREALKSLLTKARGRKKRTSVTAPRKRKEQTSVTVPRKRKEPAGVTAPRKRKEPAGASRKRKAVDEPNGEAAKKQCTLMDYVAA